MLHQYIMIDKDQKATIVEAINKSQAMTDAKDAGYNCPMYSNPFESPVQRLAFTTGVVKKLFMSYAANDDMAYVIGRSAAAFAGRLNHFVPCDEYATLEEYAFAKFDEVDDSTKDVIQSGWANVEEIIATYDFCLTNHYAKSSDKIDFWSECDDKYRDMPVSAAPFTFVLDNLYKCLNKVLRSMKLFNGSAEQGSYNTNVQLENGTIVNDTKARVEAFTKLSNGEGNGTLTKIERDDLSFKFYKSIMSRVPFSPDYKTTNGEEIRSIIAKVISDKKKFSDDDCKAIYLRLLGLTYEETVKWIPSFDNIQDVRNVFDRLQRNILKACRKTNSEILSALWKVNTVIVKENGKQIDKYHTLSKI